MRQRRRKEQGFTLVEVLVSFTILSLSLIVLFRAIGDGARNIAVVRERTAALDLARSKLETVGYEIPLRAGETTGDGPNGERWRMIMTPEKGEQRAGVQGYWIMVQVTDKSGRDTVLRTYRIGWRNE